MTSICGYCRKSESIETKIIKMNISIYKTHIVYYCKHCGSILSIQIDPTEVIEKVVETAINQILEKQ